jgi:hypothetical protein
MLDRADEVRKMSNKTAVGPECIARAVEKAAAARWPRARYVAPLRTQLMIGLLRALPSRWADFITR